MTIYIEILHKIFTRIIIVRFMKNNTFVFRGNEEKIII